MVVIKELKTLPPQSKDLCSWSQIAFNLSKKKKKSTTNATIMTIIVILVFSKIHSVYTVTKEVLRC